MLEFTCCNVYGKVGSTLHVKEFTFKQNKGPNGSLLHSLKKIKKYSYALAFVT